MNDEAFEQHLQKMQKLGLYPVDETETQPETSIPVIPLQKNKMVAALMVACVIGLLGFIFWPKNTKTNPLIQKTGPDIEVLTAMGKKDKVILPDGTQVWLNGQSKLSYSKDFGLKNREVRLSGEAYFDVVKNENLPFYITTADIKIKVTGTAFNLKAYPDESITETSLVRGKVEVTVNARPSEKYILHPNEKLVVRDQEPTTDKGTNTLNGRVKRTLPFIQLQKLQLPDNDSIISEASWVYNRLIFDDDSFEQIAKKMTRWYGVEVTIQDPNIAAIHFNYQIKNETIEEALSNMQLTAKFQFTRQNNSIQITK